MISFRLATKARALGFRVDRKAETIDKLPIAGATITLEVESKGTRHTATRVAAGVVGGVVFLPLALVGLTKSDTSKLYITVTAADGRKATRIAPAGRHQVALDLMNALNNSEITV